jgi:glucose dehydrogenase
MVNDPRDARAYQIGIAFLGLAAVVAIAGVAWGVVDQGISHEFWIGAGAISGVFVGALIHFPFPRSRPESPSSEEQVTTAGVALVLVGIALGCGALVVANAHSHSFGWCGLGATFGGVLLGLPIPSPGRRDG